MRYGFGEKPVEVDEVEVDKIKVSEVELDLEGRF